MEEAEEIQEFYRLSIQYLDAAKSNLKSELIEPAMFNSIHALELALKAALIKKTGNKFKTHNIGGEFGKHFREIVGKKRCRRINRILMKYNFPRYPEQPTPTKEEVEQNITFISDMIEHDIYRLLDR
ncbi:MAG: HEPN domain-containing protein [Candidatus Saliniplasma sp.]